MQRRAEGVDLQGSLELTSVPVLLLPARAPPVSFLSPEPEPGLSDSYYL